MSSEKSLTPQIRFKGFTEAWEQRKLGELMEVTSVRRVHQDEWTTQGVRFLRARDLVAYANNTEIELPLYISKELYEKYTAQSGKVEIGDLLVTGVGTIGVPWLVETPSPVYFKDGNIIWFKNKNAIYGKYFYYAFTSAFIQNFIKESAGTGTVGTYTIDTGKKTPIYIPPTFEQHKIASAMKRFDSLITLHQRKLDALKKIKSALLEKMFPKNGSNVPEIRFTGFTEAWEQRKVFEIVNRLDNLRVPVASNLRIPGNTPYYGANGIQDYVSGFTHNGEFVLVAEDGANDLKNYPVHYVSGKIWVNNHAHVLQGLERVIDNRFLSFSLVHCDIEVFLVGGGRSKLNANTLMNELTLSLPNLNEQKNIGGLFFKLDDLITLHQRKLDALKKIKSALLEKMFV